MTKLPGNDTPECFGVFRGAQSDAENDCDSCAHDQRCRLWYTRSVVKANTEAQTSKRLFSDTFPVLTIPLLPGTEEYAADIKSFVDFMVWKLHKNRKKGYWGDADIEQCLEHLDEEIKELKEAVASGSTAWIIEESCDSANMALIIASAMMRKATKK